MEKNKTGKYLKYAIGEIVLVMIGILLALQINNWNERKKAKVIEKELLQQFHAELNLDIKKIENTIKVYQKINNSCMILIEQIKNRKVYNDSLNYHFAAWNDYDHFTLNSGAISNLSSRGVEIISNPDLRNNILKLYNQTYTYSTDIGVHFREDHIAFTIPMYLKRIEPIDWKKEAIPINYEALLNDHEFMNHLQWIKNASFFNMNYYKGLIKEIKLVIDSIRLEIKSQNLRYDQG